MSFLVLSLLGCPKEVAPEPAVVAAAAPTDDLLAVAWVQTAAEYDAAALTVYQSAASALDRALADPTWTAATEQSGDFGSLPPAIVVDVDETVMDNSPYQARNLLDGGSFEPRTWGAWVDERRARAVPGAAAALSAAKAKGVATFYVSNRDAAQAEATRANLASLGFPDTEDLDTFLFKPAEGPREKTVRRAAVAKDHRIVLMFGDNLFDFVEQDKPDAAARDAMVAAHQDWWGTRWFLVPNPMYGSWDDALHGYSREVDAAGRHQDRERALDPAR